MTSVHFNLIQIEGIQYTLSEDTQTKNGEQKQQLIPSLPGISNRGLLIDIDNVRIPFGVEKGYNNKGMIVKVFIDPNHPFFAFWKLVEDSNIQACEKYFGADFEKEGEYRQSIDDENFMKCKIYTNLRTKSPNIEVINSQRQKKSIYHVPRNVTANIRIYFSNIWKMAPQNINKTGNMFGSLITLKRIEMLDF